MLEVGLQGAATPHCSEPADQRGLQPWNTNDGSVVLSESQADTFRAARSMQGSANAHVPSTSPPAVSAQAENSAHDAATRSDAVRASSHGLTGTIRQISVARSSHGNIGGSSHTSIPGRVSPLSQTRISLRHQDAISAAHAEFGHTSGGSRGHQPIVQRAPALAPVADKSAARPANRVSQVAAADALQPYSTAPMRLSQHAPAGSSQQGNVHAVAEQLSATSNGGITRNDSQQSPDEVCSTPAADSVARASERDSSAHCSMRAGSLAAIAAARKQALAQDRTNDAARLVQALDTKAATLEQAHKQLAAARVEQAEAQSSNSEAKIAAAQAFVEHWRTAVADLTAALRSAHSETAAAQSAAKDARGAADTAASRAARITASSHAESAEMPQLGGDAHAIVASVASASTSVVKAAQSSVEAAAAKVQRADDKLAASAADMQQLTEQAEIAAGHSKTLRAHGRAAQAAAAELVAQGLAHEAKRAAEARQAAADACSIAREEHQKAQQQSAALLASQRTWQADSHKLTSIVDAAMVESQHAVMRLSAAQAKAAIADSHKAAAEARQSAMCKVLHSIRQQWSDAQAKGDLYTLDALSPRIEAAESGMVHAEAQHKQACTDADQAAGSAAAALAAQLACRDDEEAAVAQASRSAAAACISMRKSWQERCRADSSRAVQLQDKAAAATQHSEACAHKAMCLEKQAEGASASEDYALSRSLSADAQNLRHDAALVCSASLVVIISQLIFRVGVSLKVL